MVIDAGKENTIAQKVRNNIVKLKA